MKTNPVILVDESDNALGTMEKMEAHQNASLHRAVSVFIINSKGEWLLQKRALTKYHSKGLWTNACCTHPYPDESNIHAAKRRLVEEMRIYCDVKKLFSFVYKEKLDNGLTEYEFDHVFIGVCDDDPRINTDEVAEWKLFSFEKLQRDVLKNPQNYTSWFRKIYQRVNEQINNLNTPIFEKPVRFKLLKDYLETGRVDLAIEAVSFILLGLTYIEMLPPADKIIAMMVSIFFTTLGVYAFNNVTDYKEDLINKPRSAIIAETISKQNILIYSLTCKLVAMISALFISWAVFAVVSIIILGSIFYSYKPASGGGRLKDIFIIKNLTIALLWSFVPLIPLLAYGFAVPKEFLVVIFFVFISGFISSITSDLKDMEGDNKAGVKTFSTEYGENVTLIFLNIINTIGLMVIVYGWFFLSLKIYLFLLPLLCISRYYSFWLISRKKKSAAYVYRKYDCLGETALGPLALIGRLFIH